MSEQRLTCPDCGREFPFGAEEQTFFRERGYDLPKRCRECREAKKAQRGGRRAVSEFDKARYNTEDP